MFPFLVEWTIAAYYILYQVVANSDATRVWRYDHARDFLLSCRCSMLSQVLDTLTISGMVSDTLTISGVVSAVKSSFLSCYCNATWATRKSSDCYPFDIGPSPQLLGNE